MNTHSRRMLALLSLCSACHAHRIEGPTSGSDVREDRGDLDEPLVLPSSPPSGGDMPDDAAAYFAYHDDVWPKKIKSLKVQFLDGDPTAHANVIRLANEWTRCGQIDFDYYDPRGRQIRVGAGPDPRLSQSASNADIRVSFQGNGFWSLLGQQARRRDVVGKPSLMLGGLDQESAESQKLRRKVLHEFGHALGLVHEHQRLAHCLDRAAVQREFSFMKPPEIESNILQPLARTSQNFAASEQVDYASIMIYALPERLFKAKAERAADCEPTVSTIDISRLDCQAIEYFYGPRTTAFAEIDTQPDLPHLAFANSSTPTTQRGGHQWYSWQVKAGPAAALADIARVTYKLHPSFRRRVVDGDPAQDFAITNEGWGEFDIGVTVTYKDGRKRRLVHRLELGTDTPAKP